MNFESVFIPQSIALIGASRDEKSVGFSLLKNLLSGTYKGKVYPVNPKATEIQGVHCFATIKDISESINLGIIAIPAQFVISAAKEAIEKGIKALIVISAGF